MGFKDAGREAGEGLRSHGDSLRKGVEAGEHYTNAVKEAGKGLFGLFKSAVRNFLDVSGDKRPGRWGN